MMPGDGAEGGGVGGGVEECREEDEEGECHALWGRVLVLGEDGGMGREVEKGKGEGGKEEAGGHEGNTEEENAAAAEAVDEVEGDKGEGEVCQGDGERG